MSNILRIIDCNTLVYPNTNIKKLYEFLINKKSVTQLQHKFHIFLAQVKHYKLSSQQNTRLNSETNQCV